MVFTCFLIDEPPNFLKESAGRKKNRPASVLLCQGGGITEPTRALGSARRIGDRRARPHSYISMEQCSQNGSCYTFAS